MPRLLHAGDVILFHDGMRTLCTGRAWEEKDQVHCEYRGAVLTYPRRDVLRIEKAPVNPAKEEVPKPQSAVPPSPPGAPPAGRSIAPEAVKPPLSTSSAKGPGPLFYDPRRPKRYWSAPDRHHDTYEQAVAALSAEFGQPPAWVEERLADINDLNEIRERLRGELKATGETGRAENRQPAFAASGVEFYNPRRPKRYWTSPEAQHDTLADALQALSREFGKPPEWVERHMGETNDTGLIRRSLQEALAAGKP